MGHFVWFLSILLVLTVVWHALLFWAIPRTWWFWKATDYVWLVIAMFGLLGLTQRIRDEYYKEPKKVMESMRNGHLGLARWDARNQKRSAEEMLANAEIHARAFKPVPDWITINIESLKKVVSWSSKISSVLEDAPEKTGWRDEIVELMKVTPDEAKGIEEGKRRLKRDVDDVLSCDNTLTFYQEDSRFTDAETTSIFLAPYLLVLALSIRFTKVTAELTGRDKVEVQVEAMVPLPPEPMPEPLAEEQAKE